MKNHNNLIYVSHEDYVAYDVEIFVDDISQGLIETDLASEEAALEACVPEYATNASFKIIKKTIKESTSCYVFVDPKFEYVTYDEND